MLKGTNVTVKFWTGEQASIVEEWYYKEEYAAFFKSLQGFNYPSSFRDLPQISGQHILEIHAKGVGFCGLITVYQIDPISRTCLVGVIIDDTQKGRGIMTDAGLTLFKWLFEKHNMRKIGIEYSEDDGRISKHIMRFWKMFDSKATDKIDDCPWFEGRRKKHSYYNGSYHNILSFSMFRNHYNKMIEFYKSSK